MIDDLKIPYDAVFCLPVDDGGRQAWYFHLNESGNLENEAGVGLSVQPFADNAKRISQSETSRDSHASCILRALDLMRQGPLRKVIVSRVKHVARKSGNLHELIGRLCEAYPGAFVYHLKHPQWGEWIGATPEILLKKNGNRFTTVALAGTLATGSKDIWSLKLREEQALVAEFIDDVIDQFNFREKQVRGPVDLVAGPVRHLCTTFSFESDTSVHDLLTALHPTPAVCGLPRDQAREFIEQNENHERRLYTGYIGLDVPDGESIYMVNLRCMQVFDDHFELHLGGGVTSMSTPEEEWEETERKSKVLMNIIEQ